LPGLRRRGPLRDAGRRQPRPRHLHVCTTIHYENPLNVVGTLPVWQDKVLLCRRNIEPRKGLWTLPAASWSSARPPSRAPCARPIEEAGARVEMQGLYT
jgi:hypothetical protein